MAALSCEICGGKLVGKPGGIFECDSCGMEYSTEWARAKVQEIKGTVKVEGTVEVQGTVKVEGGVNMESLLKRGQMALEDRKWEAAERYFDQALDMDPECGAAYFGIVMAKLRGIVRAAETTNWLDERSLERARRFADAETAQRLAKFDEERKACRDHIAKQKEIQLQEEALRSANAKKLEILRRRADIAHAQIAVGGYHTVGLRSDGTVVAVGKNDAGQCNVSDWKNIVAIAAGGHSTIGLCADGTVVATGPNINGECDVETWRNVVSIASSGMETLGLCADGTVMIAGNNMCGECDVDDWNRITAIAGSGVNTYGLYIDGTVVATGDNGCGQCNTENWRDIIAVSAGGLHTVGLRSDGTVVSIGDTEYGKRKVKDWKDIVLVRATNDYTVGLCADGTVRGAGFDKKELQEMQTWRNIVAISVKNSPTIGLCADGTVVAVGWNKFGQCNVSNWTDVVAVDSSGIHTVAVRADGTVVATGCNDYGQCEVSEWKLFNSIETLEQEREALLCEAARCAEAARLEEEERRQAWITALKEERHAIATELPTIKGLFAGGKRGKLEARLAEIQKQLNELEE